jgi:general secretion pathway protein J
MSHALRVHGASARSSGFTLIEVLVTLLILAALALLSFRGLDTVLTTRDQVVAETAKWEQVEAFIARFRQDAQLAAPNPARAGALQLPPWQGVAAADATVPLLQFSRFAGIEGQDRLRRLAYTLNAQGELELWLWPALDAAQTPERHVVLEGVESAVFDYLGAELVWVDSWPRDVLDAAIPRAVRLRLVLASGEIIVRTFALAA